MTARCATPSAAIGRGAIVLGVLALAGCSALTGYPDLVFDDPTDMGRADAGPRSDVGHDDAGGLDARRDDADASDGDDEAGPSLDAGPDVVTDAQIGDAAMDDMSVETDALVPDGAPGDSGLVPCASAATCNDSNPCTMDTCEGGFCRRAPLRDGMPCDDENECTTNECDAGRCMVTDQIECTEVPTGPCDDAFVCEPDSGTCEPVRKPVGASCIPTNPCTYEPACTAAGVCAGDITCGMFDDGNPCTTAQCEPEGCVQAPRMFGACVPGSPGDCCAGRCVDLSSDAENCGSCGNPCSEGAFCGSGTCRMCGGHADCDDGLGCTDDECDIGSSECEHDLRSDTCIIEGVCYDAMDRNPADQCLRCDPAVSTTGWTAHTDSCDDGLFCTITDRCQTDRQCVGMPRVCPGTECTRGVCLEGANRCAETALPDRKPCGLALANECCGGACVLVLPGC